METLNLGRNLGPGCAFTTFLSIVSERFFDLLQVLIFGLCIKILLHGWNGAALS